MQLEVLVGMIASGKSTYAKHRAKEGALVICHDDITQMLHCEYRYEPVLRDFYRRVMLSTAEMAFEMGRDVVIDRTHLTKESRTMWVQLGEVLKIPVVAVTFPIEQPFIHATRRMSEGRGRPYEEWLKVAEHHYKQAQTEPLGWELEGFTSVKAIQRSE